MPAPLTAAEILSREFLETRCKILELAAAFDRLDRAEGSVADDPRTVRLREALTAVQKGNVFPFDDNLVSRPGPRLVAGLEELAKLFHPDLMK